MDFDPVEGVKKKYPNAISKLVVDFLFDVLGGVYDDKSREHWKALGGDIGHPSTSKIGAPESEHSNVGRDVEGLS